VVTAAAIVVTAAAIVVTAAAIVVTAAAIVVTAAAIVVTAAAILNLIPLIPINLLVQKVGKIEVMGTLLRILNMKVAGVGEKGEFQMEVMLLMMKISNPFL
jgi:hypothetical protein